MATRADLERAVRSAQLRSPGRFARMPVDDLDALTIEQLNSLLFAAQPLAASDASVLEDVRSERRHYGATMSYNECVDLCNAVAWKNRSDTWGVNAKNFGEHGTRFDGTDCASDIIHHRTTDRLIDCLIAAGEHATPTWIDHGPNPHGNRPWVAPIEPRGSAQPAKFLLGVSLFWFLQGYRSRREKLRRAADTIKRKLGADFIRGFGCLGGDLFDGHDPWSRMGINPWEPGYDETLAGAVDLLYDEFELQTMFTLVGARRFVDTQEAQEVFVDRVASVMRPRTKKFVMAEMWNEYRVNKGTTPELRNMARRLRAQLPGGFWIALSSPNAVMGESSSADVLEEIKQLYGGDSGANFMTYHPSRAHNTVWAPGAQLGPHAPRDIGNTEPRGPGASAGGDTSSPRVIRDDFDMTQRAGWKVYVFHTRFGVFGGECDPHWPHHNAWQSFDDIPNFDAIAHALRTGEPSEPIEPGGEMPLPDRGRVMKFLAWLHDYYKSDEGLQREGGLWIGDVEDGHPDFEGIGAWAFDVYLNATMRGQDDAHARDEVIRQIRQSSEWQQKHPGERP